jgi:hypothetical protein
MATQPAEDVEMAIPDDETGIKRSNSAVKFSQVQSVGVAASSAGSSFTKMLKSKAASVFGTSAAQRIDGGTSSNSSDDEEETEFVLLPVPAAARFNSSAMPARSALKSSSGSLGASLPEPASLIGVGIPPPFSSGSASSAAAGAQPQRTASAPTSIGGAALRAALGGGVTFVPPEASPESPQMRRLESFDVGVKDEEDEEDAHGEARPARDAAAAPGRGVHYAEPEGQQNGLFGGSANSLLGGPRVSPDDHSPPGAAPGAVKAAATTFASDGKGSDAAPADTSLLIDQQPPPGAGGGGAAGSGGDDAVSVAASSIIVPPGSSQPLPTLGQQLTVRALLAGLLTGCAFALLAQKLVLVAGLTPSFQVAMALGCWILLQAVTLFLSRDISCICSFMDAGPLRSQEVAVASAAALAAAGSVVTGGFGPVIQALSKSAYEQVGASVASNSAASVMDFNYWQGVVWLLLVGLAGGLLVVPFRRKLLSRSSMTFPSGGWVASSLFALCRRGRSFLNT